MAWKNLDRADCLVDRADFRVHRAAFREHRVAFRVHRAAQVEFQARRAEPRGFREYHRSSDSSGLHSNLGGRVDRDRTLQRTE